MLVMCISDKVFFFVFGSAVIQHLDQTVHVLSLVWHSKAQDLAVFLPSIRSSRPLRVANWWNWRVKNEA